MRATKKSMRQAQEGHQGVFAISLSLCRKQNSCLSMPGPTSPKSDRNRYRRVTLSQFGSPSVTALRANSHHREEVDRGHTYRARSNR